MEQVTALPVSYSVPSPCHPQTQQGHFQEKAWFKLLFLEHAWRSAILSDGKWNILAQSPPQPGLHSGTASFSPSPLIHATVSVTELCLQDTIPFQCNRFKL